MKQVVFEDVVYYVPSWVKFMARDSDDCLFGYDHVPRLEDRDWVCDAGRSVLIVDDKIDWRESLAEVKVL